MPSTLPPAESGWFTVSRHGHGSGVSHITEPHVDPFLRCNIWHVAGRDTDLLVDTGLGLVGLMGALPEFFRGRRVIVVATHYHYDHTGGLHEFDERWIHDAEADLLTDAEAIGGRLRTDDLSPEAIDMLEAAGYRMPPDGELLTAVPAAGFDTGEYSVTPCSPTRRLVEGDLVDLGDRAFEVLHLPGHSPGSIGLWEEETGVLFSGDAVYDGPLLDFGDDSDIGDYRRTMERLRGLPARVVHGGHEPSFDRVRLVELCDAYLRSRPER